MFSIKFLVVLILAAVASFHPINAARSGGHFGFTVSSPAKLSQSLRYEIINNSTNPGNSRFVTEIGLLYGLETLSDASEYVLHTLYEGQKPHYGKDYTFLEAIVESFGPAELGRYPAVASTVGNKIRINSDYIQYFPGDVKYEFTGIMYHESTHVWQWTGNGMAPVGLVNGIADYVRLKAGWPSVNWGMRGSGERWDEGYFVTAYFLEYCDKIKGGFVTELNALMREGYSDRFFAVILGKTVDELWIEYKAEYVIPGLAPSPEC